MERVNTIGTITKAIRNIIPGAKNFIGTEMLVRYANARIRMQIPKKIAMLVSPVPMAASMKKVKVVIAIVTKIILAITAINLPLKILKIAPWLNGSK